MTEIHPERDPSQRCPCGSGDTYAACCRRFHAGAPAPTAEALMRSRYSANALMSEDPGFFGGYLHRSWAPETRPALAVLSRPGARWTRLAILGVSGGGPFETHGTVEFVASYEDPSAGHTRGRGRHHELSRFRRESGQWFYIDGDVT